uniref:Uncharacterized protein n=1 Tax=Periophthalmus magnuspinnatus TaxID=409849 RepID=A0A3B3ZE46_9GOBI
MSSSVSAPVGSGFTMSGWSAAQSRLVHYFAVCGLDPQTGLEPDQSAGKRSAVFALFYAAFCQVQTRNVIKKLVQK